MINHPTQTHGVVPSRDILTDFDCIKVAIARQFERMSAHNLFRTGVEKDILWAGYLSSFPEGANPIFRKRSEHDCSCCRQFVRAVGDVVAIIDGKLVSIWDIEVDHVAYQTVANTMSALVKGRSIDNHFLHTEAVAGTDKNFEDAVAGVKTWQHFFIRIPNSRVCRGIDMGPRLSEFRALHDVLFRSLSELTIDAVDTALELIAQNSLYRGQEHQFVVAKFRETKMAFDQLAVSERDNFVWLKTDDLPAAVSKIRNTSIGTLLTDLSEGRDMVGAVKSFENMVAPANYKRPTALVTKAMVEKAKATVEQLGLTSALERRYASLTDITINNILFADRNARKVLAGDVFDDIAAAVPVKRSFDKVEEVGIDKFITEVLTKSTSIEVLVENRHVNNLVSLIAPADPTAGLLFKWDNRFSWSYHGDFADSIKERIKRAGGNVSGELCCRLGWFNRDDLDFHMQEAGGTHIYFGDKRSPTGGCLDVDMNIAGETREPVENIFYNACAQMPEGAYHLFVHQFRKRDAMDVGFEAEIDFKGAVYRFAYDRALKQNASVSVAKFRYSKSAGMEIIDSLPMTTVSRKVWGIDTETFHKVNVVMFSPNHWNGHGVGNRHYFFMLAGCKNDGTARGLYNEHLKADLDPHRKVFEMVGARMRTETSDEQLSGIGFSSTQRNHAIFRVTGAFTRTLRVTY